MTSPKIKTAAASDETSIAAVLALAFSTDPGARWAWPHPQKLLTYFPAVIKVSAAPPISSVRSLFASRENVTAQRCSSHSASVQNMSEAPLHVHAAPQQTSFPDLLRMLCLAAHHASFFRFEFVYAPTVDRK